MIKNLSQLQANAPAPNENSDLRSLKDQSRQELKQLASDLSKGFYKNDSKQRKQILQMIADKLAENPGKPP